MRDLVILGAGGHGREVMWVALRMGTFRPIAFLDETYDQDTARRIHGIPVVRSLAAFVELPVPPAVVCGTGHNDLRRRWAKEFSRVLEFATLVDPAAQIGPAVRLGAGTVVAAGSVLTVDVWVGDHVNINVNCAIHHDTKIGDFSNLSPGCLVTGGVSLGEGCNLGAGSVILPRQHVGAETVVGAGSVVTKDLPGRCVAVGVPAEVIRHT